jgi:carbonic anhydrase
MSKKKFIFLAFLFVLINSWNFDYNGKDWPDSCKTSNQCPINISPPFNYKELKIKFNYNDMNTQYYLSHDQNFLRLDGDFGYITYNNEIYTSSEINFFSPSIHNFNGRKLPLEMNIIHMNNKNEKITVSVLFKEDENQYSLIFGKLGFDNEKMKDLNPYEKTTITESINLSKYIDSEKDFFYYEGVEPFPPCEKKNLYIILTDILYINKDQLKNFPKILKNKSRTIQDRNNREIFITTPLDTFDEKIEENRKILSENSNREKENEILNKIKEQNNENKNIEVDEDLTTNINEDELGVTTPFLLVEKKVLVKDKIFKKVDINLLSSPNNNNSIKIDKEIPLNFGELVNKSLKEKYLIWIALYKNLVEGIRTSNITETQKQTIFFQLSLIDKELTKKRYKPYIDIKKNNIFKKENYLKFPKKQQYEYQKIENYINNEMKKQSEYHPYKFNELNIELEAKNAEGRKSLFDSIEYDIFNITSWPIECKNSKYLSPINFNIYSNTIFISSEKKIEFNFEPPKNKIIMYNDDYKLIVLTVGNFGTIKYIDHIYEIKRFLIHSPSEHTLNELRSDMEIQIICMDNYKNIAAISLLLNVGEKEFEFLNSIGFSDENNFLYSKKLRNNEKIEINVSEDVKKNMNLGYIFNENNQLKFLTYVGTTTTPPCKSNVRWFVLMDTLSISQKQFDMFPVLYGRFTNIRGLQAINERKIEIINSN